MAKKEYGARKQAILAIIKARPGISSTDVRTAYDAKTGKDSGKSTVSSSLTELHGAGDVRREKVLSDNCGYFYRYWLTELVCGFPVAAAAPVQPGKPVHMKPFNMEHARAGAPFCCRDGEPATVLKWDGRGDYSLIGMFGANDLAASWTDVGCFSIHDQDAIDLVMLPLGFIDGKPVWVGDEIETKSFSATGAWEPVKVCPGDHGFTTCRWPAPAPVYPETLLTLRDAGAFCDRHKANVQVICEPIHVFEEMQPGTLKMTVQVRDGDPFTAIANFALRHAIDAGQVVLPNGDGMAAELVRAQDACAETRKMLSREAARDLAIALAVQNACVSRCEPIAGRAQLMRAIGSIDLNAIIAGVAK